MKILLKYLLSLGAMIMLASCVSFTSGEIKVDKEIAIDMFKSENKHPYSDIKVSWENYPYRNGADKIGSGEIDYETGKFKVQEDKPEQVEPKDIAKLDELAKKVFKKAGLYDRNSGKGTLELKMETLSRWTYGELINIYLVETPLVMIVPRSLPTVYGLSAEIETSTGTAKISLSAINRTHFFLLLAPAYPLFPPSSGEKKILNQIMWRMATEVFEAHRKADMELAQNPSLKNRSQNKKNEAFSQLEQKSNNDSENNSGTQPQTDENTDYGQTYYESSVPDSSDFEPFVAIDGELTE